MNKKHSPSSRRRAPAELLCLLAATATLYAAPSQAVPAGNQLPTNPNIIGGEVSINTSGNIMNITQGQQNSFISWGEYSIGANATVNYTGPDNFNSLNYVNSGAASEIYGNLNASGGSVYLINPSGVTIGDGAQITVGSLYVTARDLADDAKANNYANVLSTFGNQGIAGVLSPEAAAAQIMSLGTITSANTVTFDGGRIVIDAGRLAREDSSNMMDDGGDIIGLRIRTTDADNLVLGYSAYDETSQTYEGKQKTLSFETIDDTGSTKRDSLAGYMWVETADQLQHMSTNLSGSYALRNSIDLESTPFTPIGGGEGPTGGEEPPFTGKLDGLGFSVSKLTIGSETNSASDQGLFGYASGATFRNLVLASGSVTTTGSNTGGLVGRMDGGVVENVASALTVSGGSSTGGLIGSLQSSDTVTLSGAMDNSGAVTGGNDTGGLIGSLSGSGAVTLSGAMTNSPAP